MYCTLEDIELLFRALTPEEQTRANALIPTVEDALRQEAFSVNKDLDTLVEEGKILPNVLKAVIVDIIGRMLNVNTSAEALSQMSESALGYTVSGTYLSPGGGLFIKNAELKRLGLQRQKIGVINFD